MWVRSLGWEDPLEEEMATPKTILACRIPLDKGTWWAIVCRVTKSQKDWSNWAQAHSAIPFGWSVFRQLWGFRNSLSLCLLFSKCLQMEIINIPTWHIWGIMFCCPWDLNIITLGVSFKTRILQRIKYLVHDNSYHLFEMINSTLKDKLQWT